MLFIKNFKLKKISKKLSNKFINSFKIVKIVKTQTYRLILFDTFKIYSIFHVSYIKSYKRRSNDDVTLTLFLFELIDNQLKWKIKKILKKKFFEKKIFYKIRWIEYFDEYIEWIFEKWIKNVKKLQQKYEKKINKIKK